MNFYTSQLFGATILFPALLGIIYFRHFLKSYRPFIYVVWLGLLNDVVGFIGAVVYRTNTAIANIYTFFDFLLIVVVFWSWSSYGNNKKYLNALMIAGALVWVGDNIIFHTIFVFNNKFRVFYSFVIVALSIWELNKVLFTERKSIWKNARFLICTGFILFYTYKAIFEIFYLVDARFSDEFYMHIFDILVVTNAITNIIYGLAILCIPTKKKFTMPY
jgi:hypothetical protein